MRRATHRLPGLLLTEHEFRVPLDHAAPTGEQITVFAREAVAPRKRDQDLPWLVFLQGGPGGLTTRPTGRSGWLGRALVDHRVLLLDQRGTGRSTPQTRQTLAPLPGAAAQARRLTHFRADSIVKDAELIRRELLGDAQWSLLGQSFGGFASLTYLSFAPEGLRDVMISGGLPPLGHTADDVYRATYDRVASRQQRFAGRYPEDQVVLDSVADHVARVDVRLPSGDPLSVPRLQQLGMGLGTGDGAEALHYLLEQAWAGAELADGFLVEVERKTTFVDRPLYALLHESIYCDGPGHASAWAAQRELDKRPDLAPDVRPLQLTGEMIYPWMIETDRSLAPLAEAANLLAEHEDWGALYDHDRLAVNKVPVAAAVFHDDMYVEYSYSMEAVARLGAAQPWVTNEFSHDGLRSDARVIDRLFDMVAGDA